MNNILTKEEIDRQLSNHSFQGDQRMLNTIYAICLGADCVTKRCDYCIGRFYIRDLTNIEPKLTWENIGEAIQVVQILK